MLVAETLLPGGPENLRIVVKPVPVPRAHELLIEVHAAGMNRGDIYQRQGVYLPPAGTTDIPGLEVAGIVAATGSKVVGWSKGDRVCALLAGGGHAQYAIAPEGQCLPAPQGLSMVQAAALPEACFTCWTTLFEQGALQRNETLLIHGGSSGIGMTAIQLAKAFGAKVIATAGSKAKCVACIEAGADHAINYRTEDFSTETKRITKGVGVDVVLDMVAGSYVARDIAIMAPLGRHVTIGVMGGTSDAVIPMNIILRNRLVLTASTLRGRSLEEKRSIRDSVLQRIWPLISAGKFKPYIYSTFPLERLADAHREMESGMHIGKIILTMKPDAGAEH